ncbi:MAG TPA: hypothetical protein DHV12_01965, partial [Thermotogae bacterium]|nr:hypothetical protein [Thermotogota bacterium]
MKKKTKGGGRAGGGRPARRDPGLGGAAGPPETELAGEKSPGWLGIDITVHRGNGGGVRRNTTP